MRKIIVVFLVTLLYFSTMTITSNNLTAEASSGEDYYLDQDYIYSITKNLSDIINNPEIYPEDTIAKGRWSGTDGEHYAATQILALQMGILGLIDPTDENTSGSYLEQIRDLNLTLEEGLVAYYTRHSGNFTELYDILDRGLTLNHTGTKKPVDCFITLVKDENDSANYNYTVTDAEIIKAENYTCTDDFLKNVYVNLSGINVSLTADNLSLFNAHELELMTGLTESKEPIFIESIDTDSIFTLKDRMKEEFEDYYDFNFSNITSSNSSTYPSFLTPIENVTDGFVFFEEAEAFNPDINPLSSLGPDFNLLHNWAYEVRSYYNQLRYEAWNKTYNGKLKGILVYDYDDLSHNLGGPRREIPKICINGTIGEEINNSVEDCKVDFYINQSLNNSIVSYNVIGQITGTDPDKYVIIGCLYDSWWCQGTVDSAIGMSIVLAIAKYFQDNNITPRYTIRFVGYGSEEASLGGAYNYEATHLDEDIIWVIDLNQFGFSQPNVSTTLHLATNGLAVQYILPYIIDNTDYSGRVEDEVDLELMHSPIGSKSDVDVFSQARLLRSEEFIDYFFKNIKNFPNINFSKTHWDNRNELKGIMFLRDGLWYRHHRDGIDHTSGKHEFGDSMLYYSPENVNVVSELILNVTKFTCVNPDCSFNGDPVYTLWDSDDTNNYNDGVNVTFTVNTTIPIDQVAVRLVVYPQSQLGHPLFPVLYRLRQEKEYIVKSDKGINGYINISIPDNFPKGKYNAELYISDSRDDAILDALDSSDLIITGLELVDLIDSLTGWNLLEDSFPIADAIRDMLRVDLIDLIEKLHDYRSIRKFLLDYIGFGKLRDDTSERKNIYMGPSNEPPNAPEKPDDLGKGPLNYYNWYGTSTTDPDPDDKIRFQWNWNGLNGRWCWIKYDSDEYHLKPHRWWLEGLKAVKVRAKNPWNPNVFSYWSEIRLVNVNPYNIFDIVTGQSSQNNINNENVYNSYDSTVVVRGESNEYQGYTYGLTGTTTYEYDFSGLQTNNSENPNYTFVNPGVHYVNFTANDSSINVSYNLTINVVNTSACFSMNQLGAKPNQTILFNDTTISYHPLVNWSWDFDDGNISYDRNVSHSFSQPGVYNVTFNVTNNNDEIVSFWQHVYVESNPPYLIDASYSPISGTLGDNISLYVDLYDNNESGINSAYINISYPDNTSNNFTMYKNENSSYDFEFVFNDTMQVGWYYYTIWFTDEATNSNCSPMWGFEIMPGFGYPIIGNFSKNICDNISGSNFIMLVNGTAESITAYIHANQTIPSNAKCMIYRVNDSQLVGTTEEKTIDTGTEADWVTFNFTGTKPSLTTDTSYILACWSNDTCNLSYDNASNNSYGRYKSLVYGDPPDPTITWDACEPRLYSIYCTYSTVPEIKSVQVSPSLVGFGYNVTITTQVEDYYALVDSIKVNITFPDSSYGNYSMTEISDDTYRYVFNDSWLVGEYNFSIWVVDKLGAGCSSGVYSFNVSADATISICTLKDSYEGNENVNLTDPPVNEPPIIGYELLDDGEILRIWNRFDSYYFDTDNGIQLTNHYDEYWSTNVLMLGYYNNDVWNLIYRTDELNGFNKNVECDDETYVNATIWKDLSYGGYDFRLAIRYYLGVDDNELTVIPYIKNIGDEDIPYNLGFAWEIKDIQVDMTPGGDFIEIDNYWYYLNNSNLDETYTNLNNPAFYIRENITESTSESLYLRWDDSLNYKLQVKSRTGQYNAPVTLGIKIGTLDAGQEKYTSLFWHDASEAVYYFDQYMAMGEEWTMNPGYMVDSYTSNYATTTLNSDVELCLNNTCTGDDLGSISKVELRCHGYFSGMNQRDIILRPVFSGIGDGDNHNYETTPDPGWSSWFDITNDNNAPEWDWIRVRDLDCDVEAGNGAGGFTLKCSKVEMRITYNVNYPPGITYQYPLNGTTNVSINPVLTVTVSDPESDNMNISWLSNSSGSWEVFGTNSSVGDGTYHQTMDNASTNGQWWYWKVNVSDGSNYNESSVYRFYTGYQSKIVNTGSTHFKGYLLMQVQYYNNSSSSWVVADDTVNETSPRTMLFDDPGGTLGQNVFALDTIFNGLVNTNDLSGFGNGTYRVYAALRDPDGNILVCDDETKLVATYEFTVNFN